MKELNEMTPYEAYVENVKILKKNRNVLKKLFNTEDLVPYAIKWILMHDAVSVVIPGASKEEQVYSNNRAEDLPDLTPLQMKAVEDIYNKYIRESVHNNW